MTSRLLTLDDVVRELHAHPNAHAHVAAIVDTAAALLPQDHPLASLTLHLLVRLAASSFSMSPHIHVSSTEEHTSELQSLMRISYAVLCLKKKTNTHTMT